MYLLFDVGGTKTRVAVIKPGERIARSIIVATQKKFNEEIRLISTLGKELSHGKKITAVAGGVPGPLNLEKSKIINASNLRDWNGKPLRHVLTHAFHAPVFIENDAALEGLGEAVYGAVRGRRIVVYITIGTGVGGARIVGGKIDEIALGFEPGHQLILGRRDLESLVSGGAFEKHYRRKPSGVTDPKIWNKLARVLAVGIANSIVHWSPNIVILGGSMMKKPGISAERVRFHLKRTLTIFPTMPKVVPAKLGDAAGLHGAYIFLRQSLQKKI